jgi:glutamine amidotransferase
MTRIAVVDYGAGNLVSIEQALSAAGAEVVLAHRADSFAAADALVVPGVGAAGPAMARLRRRGLCLGLQLLFEGSDEDGAVTLGVLPGRTVRLSDAPRLPHIGWNQVERQRAHPLFAGIDEDADFYFVHSYAAAPGPGAEGVILAETAHGGRFVSAIARGSLAGVQFHPERSGRDGLRLLANFVGLAQAGGAASGRTRVPVLAR